jgi:ABC-type Na+ efflux pump permease subunit
VGYEFATDVAVTVNGNPATVTYNADGTITVTYTFPATSAAPAEDPKTPEYKITAGAGGIHMLNSDTTLQITCSGALDKLTGIYVDETKLAATNYELVSGSTVLTLKAEYLNTLSVGTHKLKFAYSDGSAETTFVINETSEEGKTTEAPKANETSETTETPQTGTTPQTTVTPNATTGTTTTSSNTAATPDTGDFTPIDLMLVVLLLSALAGAYFVTVGLKQRKKK